MPACECVSDLIRRIIMKPRLNPPDVSAVVPPPQPPLLWQRNDFLCQLDSNQSSYYGLQRMGSERVGWEIRGFHWPITFYPLLALLQMAALPLFRDCGGFYSTDSLHSSSLHQCHPSSSPSISLLPQWGSSFTSPAWCHLGTCPYVSPGTKMASPLCQAPPLVWQ